MIFSSLKRQTRLYLRLVEATDLSANQLDDLAFLVSQAPDELVRVGESLLRVHVFPVARTSVAYHNFCVTRDFPGQEARWLMSEYK